MTLFLQISMNDDIIPISILKYLLTLASDSESELGSKLDSDTDSESVYYTQNQIWYQNQVWTRF